MLSKILEKLGLTAAATEAEALAAVDAVLAPAPSAADAALTALGFTAADVPGLVAPAAFAAVNEKLTVAQGEVVALTAQVGTLTASLSAATAAEATRQVFAAVDSAIAARKATPAQRDALVALATADLVAFTAFTAAAPEVLAAGNATPPSGSAAATEGLTEAEKAFCAAYGFKEASYLRSKQQGALN